MVDMVQNYKYQKKINQQFQVKSFTNSIKLYTTFSLFHFIERKTETTAKITKSSSAEKTFLTPINNRF